MSYSRDAIKGLSWMGFFRLVYRLLTFIKIGVLARVLSPAQFGLFGIASLILAFLEMLTETGINIFLIQSKDKIDDYVSSAWAVSIIRGIFISCALIASSPFISSFFHTPEAQNLLLLTALIPFIRGFINPAEIRLQKELNFHYEFWFRTSLFTFEAIVSVVLSVLTQSVYSLVWGLVASASLEVFLSFLLISPRPRFRFSFTQVKEIINKGKWVTAYGIFNYIAQEIDTVFVGKFAGPAALGIYQMAFKISILPISEITEVVAKVAFPIYVKIGHDTLRLKSAFFKSMKFIVPFTLIAGLIIFVFPKQVIIILLGEKWLVAESVLQLLTIYGVFRAIFGSVSALFLGVHKQNYVTITTFARFIVLLAVLPVLVTKYGMIGAAYGVILSALIEVPIAMILVNKVFRITTK